MLYDTIFPAIGFLIIVFAIYTYAARKWLVLTIFIQALKTWKEGFIPLFRLRKFLLKPTTYTPKATLQLKNIDGCW